MLADWYEISVGRGWNLVSKHFQHGGEAHTAIAVFGREVGAADYGFQIGCEPDTHRPASSSGRGLKLGGRRVANGFYKILKTGILKNFPYPIRWKTPLASKGVWLTAVEPGIALTGLIYISTGLNIALGLPSAI